MPSTADVAFDQATLERFADLAIGFAANVQKGQVVAIGAELGKEEMVRALAASAYRHGARFVDVMYYDMFVKRARIEYAEEDTLDYVPPWYGERVLALSEMRVGESRQDALKKLSARVDSAELSAFVRAIIQADQLGISLGRILRVQAVDSRLKRQAAAEERAAKAPIKMLFPTVVFIFPAMFIVVLGPALLSLSKLFNF
jgi:hypothetical protein